MAQKILYVDDDDMFVRSYIDALSDEGYDVELAEDGTKAIEALRRNLPSLIIMDVIMPTGDLIDDPNGGSRTGVRSLEMIRGSMGLRMPVLFVTVVGDADAHRMIEELEKSFGMPYTLLVKPVLPSEVVEQVVEMIGAP